VATDESTSKDPKAKFLEALEKKKSVTSPNNGENRLTQKKKGTQARSGGTRMFRRKSGSA